MLCRFYSHPPRQLESSNSSYDVTTAAEPGGMEAD